MKLSVSLMLVFVLVSVTVSADEPVEAEETKPNCSQGFIEKAKTSRAACRAVVQEAFPGVNGLIASPLRRTLVSTLSARFQRSAEDDEDADIEANKQKVVEQRRAMGNCMNEKLTGDTEYDAIKVECAKKNPEEIAYRRCIRDEVLLCIGVTHKVQNTGLGANKYQTLLFQHPSTSY